MTPENSAPQPAALATLEAELAETLKGVADCFAMARELSQINDEYGHRRASEIGNAVTLLKVSAELGITIAKIKGEFNHNINVLHGEMGPARQSAKPKAKGDTPRES